jgi:hypothetical protein
MKLYDVIRKDYKEKGIADPEPMPVYKQPASPRHGFSGGVKRPTNWKKIIVIGGSVLFIVILYLIGIVFVHATVTITERQIPFSLDDAQIDLANAATADPGRLSFQTMVVTDSVTRQVFGSALTTSMTKAVGQAVIFNQYSKSSQTVRSGTTLTGANGEKYVTQATVTVPGYTGTTANKTAGSASVAIVAANVGPSYNSTGTTFTIAGWSTSNSKLFFASSAGAITGGQNGALNTLDDSDKQQTIATLEAALTEKLTRETRGQIPDNLVTFPDLQFLTINTNNTVLTGDSIQFNATLQGTMVSYLIPRDLLEQAIAAKAITDHAYPSVSIPDLGNIQVEPVSAIPADPTQTPSDVTISISGEGTIITQVSADTIQQAVLGASGNSFNADLANIPEIDTAKFTLDPFWAPYFPYKASRINVEIQ